MHSGPVRTAEHHVGELGEQWTAPLDRECLPCYLGRMLADYGCDNTVRWARRWRDACAPRATALERHWARHGGACDCAIAIKVYPETLLAGDDPVPPCSGVSRRGSTRPCALRRRPPPPA